MALATADQVRLRIADPWRWAQEVQTGDGLATQFKLAQGAPFSRLAAPSAFVPSGAAWSATGATVDTALGVASFSSVISANSAVRFTYQWAVFSDDEISHFTAVGGSVAGAALEAVRALLFDAVRRAKWAAPDGTEYDDTAAQRHLLALEERLSAEVDAADGAQGGIESWSEQQAYYGAEYGG